MLQDMSVNLLQFLRSRPCSPHTRSHASRSVVPPLRPTGYRPRRLGWGNQVWIAAALVMGWGALTPSWAAERLTVRFGPIEQSVAIADLEQFAETGEIPAGLRPYRPLLTADVRLALNSRLQLDPTVSRKLVDDLLLSSAGERLLTMLGVAIPNSTADQLQATLTLAAQEIEGLSLLSFFRAFPEDTIIIDGTSVISLASQMNLPYWQSQALSSILERELTVEGEAFQGAFDPAAPGYEQVRQQTLTFRDRSRDRNIPVDLYWSRGAPGPLVILSHGFGADRRFLSYMAQHLASHGLTVAALEHPGSNVAWLNGITLGESGSGRISDILPPTEFIDRPLDVSFLLDELQRLNRYSSLLRGKINTDQVTVIGHSLGGYTALALAGADLNLDHLRQFCDNRSMVGLPPADWLQCTVSDLEEPLPNLRDERVVQVMALNPVMGRLFNQESLSQIRIPTMILAGTDDAITPAVTQQLVPFTYLQSPKYLLTAIGGTHLSVGDPSNLNQTLTQSLFMRERRGDETEALRQLLRGLSLSFVKQVTPEADLYAPFLSAGYVQSFSTSQLKLRFNTELPANLSNWLTMAALPVEQLVATTFPVKAPNQHQVATACESRFGCLINRLPLLMFLLPGELPMVGSQFYRPQRLKMRRYRGSYQHWNRRR